MARMKTYYSVDNYGYKKFLPLHETYKIFTLALTMGCMYPNPVNEKKRFLHLGLLFLTMMPVYYMWCFDVYFCLQNRDLDNLTRQLSIGVPVMFCQFKMFIINLLRKEMKAIFDEINADYERYNDMDDDYKAIVEDNRKSLQKLQTIWTSVVLVTVSAFPLMAIISTVEHYLFKDPKRFMLHEVDVPFIRERRYDTPYFECLFAYMVYICFVLILCYLSYDGIFFLCIYHVCLKLNIIGHSLMKAFKTDDVEAMRRSIAGIVEDQCSTLRFVARIQHEYQWWLALVFSLTSIQICMDMYQILISSGGDIDPKYIIFGFAAVLHIFVPCFLVSKMSATAETLANKAYCSRWELVPDTSLRRSIAIIIMRSQKPLNIVAINMITFNMQLFVSVMQTSYSVFTLLRS